MCAKTYHLEILTFLNIYDYFYLFWKSLVPTFSNQNSEHMQVLKKNALRKTRHHFCGFKTLPLCAVHSIFFSLGMIDEQKLHIFKLHRVMFQ